MKCGRVFVLGSPNGCQANGGEISLSLTRPDMISTLNLIVESIASYPTTDYERAWINGHT